MKNMLSLLTSLLVAQVVLACDICGNSLGGHHFGLLPDYRLNMVSLSGNYRQFTSTHPTLFENEVAIISKEYYATIAAEARIFAYKNWMIAGRLPYNQFTQELGGQTAVYEGVGDVSISALHLWTKVDSTQFSHQLILGGGVKLPTGKVDAMSSEGVRLNDYLQMGSGSFDYSLLFNYLVRNEKWGLQVQTSFDLKGVNRFDYKFGNQSDSNLRLLYWQNLGRSQNALLIPFLEMGHAWSGVDYENHSNLVRNELSGGQTLLLGAGINLFIKKIGISASAKKPFWQEVAEGSIEQKTQLRLALNYLF